MNAQPTRKHVGVAAVGVLVVAVLVVGAAVALYDQPRVESVESEFGDVGEETSDVHTTVVVENPNDRPLPAVDLRYTVSLNDVVVASGVERGVRIEPGRNVVRTTAAFDNARIPDWWVSHVNGGEETTMTTTTRVEVLGPVGVSLPAERRQIDTDFLGSLAEDDESTVGIGGTDVLVVGEQRAEWGEADGETTPFSFVTDLENVHDRPVRIDGTDYAVRMNGILVGEGRTDEGLTLEPGESASFRVDAAIDTAAMQEWWVSHLRNGQSTRLEIDVWAVVDDGDERTRLPLSVFERRATFETDLLGSGETSVRPIAVEGPAFEQPTVESTSSEWGDVGDDATTIRTTVDVRNENDGAHADFVTLAVEQETTLAGVTVARGTDRVESLPQGEGSVAVEATKPHAVVPEWWAAHLRNGEVSETRTRVDAEADVAVTTLPLELEDRTGTVETDLLGDLNDDARRTEGAITVHSTGAEWVDPTAEEATVLVEADIENNRPLASLTISEVDYVVELNDVTLADERAPEEHTFAPGERRTVEFTITLNNSRMAQWWPTHVENGEVTVMDREVTATVESGGETERRQLEFLSEEVTVETDLLAEG